jgi:hypothetical protein
MTKLMEAFRKASLPTSALAEEDSAEQLELQKNYPASPATCDLWALGVSILQCVFGTRDSLWTCGYEAPKVLGEYNKLRDRVEELGRPVVEWTPSEVLVYATESGRVSEKCLGYLAKAELDGRYFKSIKTKKKLKLLPDSNLGIRSELWVLVRLFSALRITPELTKVLERTLNVQAKKRYKLAKHPMRALNPILQAEKKVDLAKLLPRKIEEPVGRNTQLIMLVNISNAILNHGHFVLAQKIYQRGTFLSPFAFPYTRPSARPSNRPAVLCICVFVYTITTTHAHI